MTGAIALGVLCFVFLGLSGCAVFGERGAQIEAKVIRQYCKQLGPGTRSDNLNAILDELGTDYDVKVTCPGDM